MKFWFKLALALYLFACKSIAQTYFNNSYEIGGIAHGSTSVLDDSVGYLVLGQEITTSYRAMSFVKTDYSGDTIWTKSFPQNQFAYYTGYSNSLIRTNDNKIAFGGTIINLLDSTDSGNALLVKLNNSADTLWMKMYGGSGLDVANITIQSADSGFVLIGATTSYGSGQSDFYMVKTDSLGGFQWQKTFGTSAQEEAYSGIKTLDNGYLLTGHQSGQMYIVKTDEDGNFQWERTIAGSAGQGFIQQFADSTYVLVGSKFVTGLSYQAYITKLTKTGATIWEQTYGGIGDQQLFAVPIILSDGSVVCSGVVSSGSPQGILIKVDSSGNEKWMRTYYKGSIYNDLFDLKLTTDNGFVMTGTTYLSTQDSWLIKVDSAGCEIANCNVGVNESEIQKPKLNIFPVPARDEITILIEGEDMDDYEITVFNILGETLKTSIENTKISISNFAAGVYFISAKSKKNQNRTVQKIIIEK